MARTARVTVRKEFIDLRLTENHFDVRLMTQDAPDRPRDVAWIKRRDGDLLEQGLKEVVIAAIDKCNSDWLVAQHPRRRQTTKTSAYYPNVRKTV